MAKQVAVRQKNGAKASAPVSQAGKLFRLYRRSDYGRRWHAAWNPQPVYWVNGEKRKLFLFSDGSALETWLPSENATYFHHAVLDAEEARRLLFAAYRAYEDGGTGIIDRDGLFRLIWESGLIGRIEFGERDGV